MTETLKAYLALTREEIQGTVDEDMPYGIPLIDQMDDAELSGFLSGEIRKCKIGLPGSDFETTDPVINTNLAGIRFRSLVGLYFNIVYAVSRQRSVPEDVVEFLQSF